MPPMEQESRLILSAYNRTGPAFGALQADAQRTAMVVEQTGRRMAGSFRGVEQSWSGMATSYGAMAAVLGGGAMVTQAVTNFASYERRLNRLGLNFQVPAKAMDGMRARMRQIADETGQSIDEVTKGMEGLAASGMSLEDALKNIPAVAKFNQIIGADMRQTADTVAVLGQNFGIAADQSEKALAMIAKAGNSGKFEAKDIALYLPQIGAAAASAGLKGEEGLARVLAMLETIRGTSAGTAEAASAGFRDLLSKATGGGLDQQFEALGVNLKGVMDNARRSGDDLIGTFLTATDEALKQAAILRKIPQEQRMTLLSTLFTEVDSRNAAFALLSAKEGTRQLARELRNVDSKQLEAFARIAGDTQSDIERLKTAWNDLVNDFGKGLVDAGAVKAMQEAGKTFKEVGDAIRYLDDMRRRLSDPSKSASDAAKDAANKVGRDVAERRENVEASYRERALRGALGRRDAFLADPKAEAIRKKDPRRYELLRRQVEEEVSVAQDAYARANEKAARDRTEGAPAFSGTDVRREAGPTDPASIPKPEEPRKRIEPFIMLRDSKRAQDDPGSATEKTLGEIERNTSETRTLFQRLFQRSGYNPDGAITYDDRGSMIQKASLGGGGGFGGSNAFGGGGSGGGGGGFGGPGGGGGGFQGPGGSGGGSGLTGPGVGAPGMGGGNRAPTNAEGRENVQSWLAFAQRPVDQGGLGLTKEQAHGVVAGLQGESGANLNPGAYNPSDRGMPSGGTAQWRNDRLRNLQAFAQSKGKDWRDRTVQQEFMRHEMLGSGGMGGGSERNAYERLKRQETRQGALGAFVGGYERPQYPGAEVAKRSQYLYGHDGDGNAAGGEKGPRPNAGEAGANGQHDPLGGAARRYTSSFGMRRHPIHGDRRMHNGQDMAAPGGSPVYSMQGGTVTSVNRHGDVTVRHPDGSTKTYRHINPEGVKEGQEVKGGDRIGSLRRRDPRSTGPHLHLEATDPNGNKIDPMGDVREANRRKPGSELANGRRQQVIDRLKEGEKYGAGRSESQPQEGGFDLKGWNGRLGNEYQGRERNRNGEQDFSPKGNPELRASIDQIRALREEASKPIDVNFRGGNFERVRDRGESETRRVLQSEMRQHRYNSYSDQGVA